MLISMIVSSSGCLYDLLTFVYESASLIPKIPRETAWNEGYKEMSLYSMAVIYLRLKTDHFLVLICINGG